MNATGIVVPDEIVEKLAAGKKPKVSVDIKGYTYRSTIAVMGGKFMLPLAKEHRDAAGVKAGDKVEVSLELDTRAPRSRCAEGFRRRPEEGWPGEGLRARCAFTHRKEHVRAIEEAKAPETAPAPHREGGGDGGRPRRSRQDRRVIAQRSGYPGSERCALPASISGAASELRGSRRGAARC